MKATQHLSRDRDDLIAKVLHTLRRLSLHELEDEHLRLFGRVAPVRRRRAILKRIARGLRL